MFEFFVRCWKYLCYVVKHKYFVLMAGCAVKAPIWRLFIHDWSKFLPCEFFAYSRKFYGKKYPSLQDVLAFTAKAKTFGVSISRIQTQEEVDADFDRAWLHHIHCNPHHPEHWQLRKKLPNGEFELVALPMPEPIVREMIADWLGAGRAQTGYWGVHRWYEENRNKILLHPDTRSLVENLLNEIGYGCRSGRSVIFGIAESSFEEDDDERGSNVPENPAGNEASEGSVLSDMAGSDACLPDEKQADDPLRSGSPGPRDNSVRRPAGETTLS